jgi:hypothetical protein
MLAGGEFAFLEADERAELQKPGGREPAQQRDDALTTWATAEPRESVEDRQVRFTSPCCSGTVLAPSTLPDQPLPDPKVS